MQGITHFESTVSDYSYHCWSRRRPTWQVIHSALPLPLSLPLSLWLQLCLKQQSGGLHCCCHLHACAVDIADQDRIENLYVILWGSKGSRSVSIHGKQRSILLPKCMESWTPVNHLQQLHHHTVCIPYWPGQHGGPQQNGQEQRAAAKNPKVQKSLRAPTRN